MASSAAAAPALRVAFYFDVISPYACVTWHVLKRYKPLWGFGLDVVPVFQGGVMAATGNMPPSLSPVESKVSFFAADLERNKAFFGVPILDPPANFFSEVAKSTIHCQRLLTAALMREEGERGGGGGGGGGGDGGVERLVEEMMR